jgi:ceramide glucosyltransferase
MTTFETIAAIVCLVGFSLHIFTIVQAWQRCRQRLVSADKSFCRNGTAPPVSIIRPVRGVDPYDEITLRSGFMLQHPAFEMILCCADANDPAVELVQKLMAQHPHVSARLLIGADHSTANPKLNNIVKGWQAANHDWIVIADCNVLMPPDYVQRMFAAWRSDTGLVCSPPIGSMPQGFWAEVECAFLNTYQARWQYAADSLGFGFAQGKSMLWRRSTLECAGGIRALSAEIAEDAAATKIVRKQGLRVRLVDRPFDQPLGHRSWEQLWTRQVRWARLRRVTFAACFAPEVLTCSLLPIAAGIVAAEGTGTHPALAAMGLVAIWYGSEALLARSAGWHLTKLSPVAWLCRDLLVPVVWVAGWVGNSFNWRGNDMRATRPAVTDMDTAALSSKL